MPQTTQPSPARGHPRAREAGVLIVGVLCALALTFTALSPASDPEAEGERTLQRSARGIAADANNAWRRLRAEPTLPATLTAVAAVSWSRERGASPAPAGVALEATSLDGQLDPLTPMIVADVRRALRAGDVDAARRLLRGTDGEDVQPDARIALAWLDVGQAARDAALAETAWARLTRAADNTITLGGWPVRALGALAVAELLPDAARQVLTSWADGSLTLPGEPGRWILTGTDPQVGDLRLHPERDVLLEKLRAPLAGTPDESLADAARDLEQARAIERTLANRIAADAPPDGAWHALEQGPWLPDLLLLMRTTPNGMAAAALIDRNVATAALQRALHEAELLPPGFSLDAGTDPAPAGRLVRSASQTSEGLALDLRHVDPDAFIAETSARGHALRAALLLLGAACLATSWLTARALARERRLSEARSAFVASVSHELRTPVSSILLMAENLEQGRVTDPAAASRYHALIRREALRLRRLVEDVLDASRLDRGLPFRVRTEAVSPRDWLLELVHDVREQVEREGGRLDVDLGELPGEVRLDPVLLGRAVQNLVDNALRHSGTRDVSLAAARDDEQHWSLHVSDAGRGVPPADRARIFEAFERLPDNETGRPGAGLGLAIVSGIVRGHGGSVAVSDCSDGPGARFTIHLPTEEPA